MAWSCCAYWAGDSIADIVIRQVSVAFLEIPGHIENWANRDKAFDGNRPFDSRGARAPL